MRLPSDLLARELRALGVHCLHLSALTVGAGAERGMVFADKLETMRHQIQLAVLFVPVPPKHEEPPGKQQEASQ